MSEREAFLAAILAEPDEDAPRLAFADWLDEHGECDRDYATAEFIRVSCPAGHRNRGLPRGSRDWLLDVASRPNRCAPGESWDDFVIRTAHMSDHELYRIVSQNWNRLVPSLVAAHAASRFKPIFPRWGSAGVIEFRWGEANTYLATPVRLRFRRGFLVSVAVTYYGEYERIAPLLALDQPLCRFPSTITTRHFSSGGDRDGARRDSAGHS